MLDHVRTYSELAELVTFEERYEYLRLPGRVGESTFGFDRVFNQDFYRSREWRDIRSYVIVRDGGCDLGVPGFDIASDILIHHINPMGVSDVKHGREWITDPEYLITTCKRTHNAIHYGISGAPLYEVPVRRPNDTKLW